MSKYLKPADAETLDLAAEVIRKYHGELLDAGATFAVLFYDDPDKEADIDGRGRPTPLLKLRGHPAAGTCKIESYDNRVKGAKDFTITLDLGLWRHLKPAERVALLDHEANHAELVRDKDDNVKHDNAGRPRLRCRLHDVQLGVFDVIIKRHGSAAIDTANVRACWERYRQTAFAWADDMAGEGEAEEDDDQVEVEAEVEAEEKPARKGRRRGKSPDEVVAAARS